MNEVVSRRIRTDEDETLYLSATSKVLLAGDLQVAQAAPQLDPVDTQQPATRAESWPASPPCLVALDSLPTSRWLIDLRRVASSLATRARALAGAAIARSLLIPSERKDTVTGSGCGAWTSSGWAINSRSGRLIDLECSACDVRLAGSCRLLDALEAKGDDVRLAQPRLARVRMSDKVGERLALASSVEPVRPHAILVASRGCGELVKSSAELPARWCST
eukprot:2823453-Prymnesium_polylepis.2